ncbi:MAG: chemotaxis protein CheW [Candidatus Dactylopiibacterium carminicum]|uniref:Chemotaxis protein CheW n=1 Tax=Candidatus Dactylopiibacterium carminicum TaxID=857335 RepID=A0A272ENQ9_9RHOO|nr:chemotaxis protein CheW [Candidatus Dactylopiibacterium carminicum]KAF7598116.1 chemotaxis protein CheW [Candidatus Dactylopiibacterium carminicum]PAS91739.1 MAG: chemotaxis protein CheW [Candidatus Dactylopiibacterium carminicum]PAS94016.1 MAG: chemotaxis protein CheW [Candidatus Dactylopiibacterium carminicum]PAS96676.1 MAG: chemotaxis protein CheW [Candidatus Dactylopiibacterium carminicum]
MNADIREFLGFSLGSEEYAVDILKVQEIRGYDAVTHVVNAPAFIKGVINLRGTIVPIVDLRIKFELGDPVYDQFTVVIVLSLAGGRVVGMVVDAVSEVVALAPNDIRAMPQMGSVVSAEYLTGLASLGERMIILLDIERLMSSPEMGLVETLAE